MDISWWQAAVLGLVQGLTEFLPVSSTAHLRIVPALLGWADPGAAFSAVIQLGTLAAVFIYFARDIARLARAALLSLWRAEVRRTVDAKLAWAIAAGNIPIVVAGLALRHWIETAARTLGLIAAMLIVVGLLLALAERVAKRDRGMSALSLRGVMVIGLFQALALIPGASRSGVTILGGLLLGLRREEAARFSFLLGVPAILGSGFFQLGPLLEASPGPGWGVVAAGLLVALISGYAAIGFLLAFLRTHSTLPFVAYRVALGALLLGLVWRGAIG